MNWGENFRWLMWRNLRYTAYALVFGFVLEWLLSLSGRPYRIEVTFLIAGVVFVLALVSSIFVLYLAWFIGRLRERNIL